MSFFRNKLLKIYASGVPDSILDSLQQNDVISTKSEDFLGIREATICMISWTNQIEIGAALALRKKVITVHDKSFGNPNLIVVPTWGNAVSALEMLKSRQS